MAILELSLDTGRKIWADLLHMERTYAGLFDGHPFAAMNDRLIAELPKAAARFFGDSPVKVIEPPRSSRERPHPTPFWPPERLPSHWIAADFTSSPIDDAMHASSLIVVWFQEEPFPVPAEAVLAQFRAIEWEAIARDFEY